MMKYIDTPNGKMNLKFASARLVKAGLPAAGDNSIITLEDFVENVSTMVVPKSVELKMAAPEMVEARDNLAQVEDSFREFARPAQQTELMEVEDGAPPATDDRMGGSSSTPSLRVHVAATGNNNASLTVTAGSAGASSSTGGAPGDSVAGAKRSRIGMTESDLSRACTIMDLPAARVTPQFLVDKPLDVRLYTPLLVDLYANVRKVAEGISLLAHEIYTFEGDFLELSPAAVAALPTTALYASCDTTSGSRLLHRMEAVHAAAAIMRAKNLRCQRAFWLANHTPGCNWDTWDQLCHREAEDAGADLCNPCFTPLTTWEEQVKAAIVAARQEAAALSKDGKTLLGPVLPRLLARQNHGKSPEWRSKGATSNSHGGQQARRATFARRTHASPTGARKPGATGKEHARGKGPGAAAGAKPAAAAAAGSGP